MKRAICLIIIASLILSIPVFAFDNNDRSHRLDVDYLKEVNKYTDSIADIKVQLDINLPMHIYDQKDKNWAEHIMQTEGLSIGGYGCTLTCTAMVFRYLGYDTDPGRLNTALGDYACPLYWYKAAELDPNISVVTYEEDPSDMTIINTLAGALQDENPVILGFEFPGNTHFIVVKRVFGDGLDWSDYDIIDPNGGTQGDLEDYMNKPGWDVYKMVVYDK